MQIKPLSESSYIVSEVDCDPHVFANSIEIAGIPGVREVVTSIETIGLFVDPDQFDPESIHSVKIFDALRGSNWRIPILFDGSDLKEICGALELDEQSVARLFCDSEFTVSSIGFLPGFPYLKGLAPRFSGLSRRKTPRIHVPKGSVGIAAGQAGIYPAESPGGWNLIGTTPLRVADLNLRFFPLNPGDTIQFYEIDEDEFKKMKNLRLGDHEKR